MLKLLLIIVCELILQDDEENVITHVYEAKFSYLKVSEVIPSKI